MQRGLVVLLAVALVALSARMLSEASEATTDARDQTTQLARLVGPTLESLEQGTGNATGQQGRYYVYWDDALTGGSLGLGLVNELVRHGYDVGVDQRDAVQVPGRVRSPDDATARVVLASGGWVEHWAGEPGAKRVAYDDPRTTAERSEFEDVRERAIAGLESLGRHDLVERLDTDLLDVALNEGVTGATSLVISRMLDLGVPAAVFILPPEVSP